MIRDVTYKILLAKSEIIYYTTNKTLNEEDNPPDFKIARKYLLKIVYYNRVGIHQIHEYQKRIFMKSETHISYITDKILRDTNFFFFQGSYLKCILY